MPKTLYLSSRAQWRAWLQQYHALEKEIWLLYPHKDSGSIRLPYADAVQEAICFGWIDSTLQKHDDAFSRQRWTPRRRASRWSELNKHHARLCIAQGRMTPAGENVLPDLNAPFEIPPRLLARLKQNPVVWEKFQALPEHYKRIRLDYIIRRTDRPLLYEKTLDYFIRQTLAGKRYGPFKNNPEIY